MEQLKDQILAQLRNSLDTLANELADRPALANAIRQERDRVPVPRRPAPRLAGVALPELLYLALAHAGLHYTRFDAIRLRTDRARRLRRRRKAV